ncbi:MAG: NAD(P)H:quinone oxidoreductase [Gammaproteobacteria bacterium]|nr:NAD(P)H:quinone oxidoreductase [Gammaproteobacteria bacterium]
MSEILVLYYSRYGTTKILADYICRGIDMVEGMQARLRTVPEISTVCEQTASDIPDEGVIYASNEDLIECEGLVMGSPTHFGNMAAALKYFIDSSSQVWLEGKLSGKPAGVFTSSSSLHGGHETTLTSMMLPLLHHGMLIVGIPYSVPSLSMTQGGGTPYGAGHINKQSDKTPGLTKDEKKIAMALGQRVAETAKKLK